MDVKVFNFLPSEVRAIEDHKYFMSEQEGREVSFEEAAEDFVMNYRADWLRAKQRTECEEQIHEIERHKWLISEARGYDVGRMEACQEWISQYASIWRSYKESLERQGFHTVNLVMKNAKSLSLRPGSLLLKACLAYDCDIFIHKKGMEYYNLVMDGKEYLHIRSVLTLVELHLARGEPVEFIAMGREAGQALDAIKTLLNGPQ
jgi:phosphotransferase system HPr-like phosphotransfer protein